MIEATPRELAEKLVDWDTPDGMPGTYEVIVLGVNMGDYRSWKITSLTITELRSNLQRLIEDERRRADEMVRRAVENAKSEWEYEARLD